MQDLRQQPYAFLQTILQHKQRRERLNEYLTPDSQWDIAAPINQLNGAEAIEQHFYQPLTTAFRHVQRRDVIFIGSPSFYNSDQYWVGSVGHYMGVFHQPFLGIPPNNKLIFLRFGEYYQIENGKIAQAKIIIDLVDLLMQLGHHPLPLSGSSITFPAPASLDGVLPQHPDQTTTSVNRVREMIRDIIAFDPVTYDSPGLFGPDGHWSETMAWYGPGSIGANYTVPGFIKDHRSPFLTAFPDRNGGMGKSGHKASHFSMIGDSNYVGTGGWPSLVAHHTGDYFGVPASGKEITLRVMDFWRVENDKLVENWVLIDMIDLFAQLGKDLLSAPPAMQT